MPSLACFLTITILGTNVLTGITDYYYRDCSVLEIASKCLVGTYNPGDDTCRCVSHPVEREECRSTCSRCFAKNSVGSSTAPGEGAQCLPAVAAGPYCTCAGDPRGCDYMTDPVIVISSSSNNEVVGPQIATISSTDKRGAVLRYTTHPCGNLKNRVLCPNSTTDPQLHKEHIGCTDLIEVIGGAGLRSEGFPVPITSYGNYTVAKREIKSMTWSPTIQPSFSSKTVTVIPKPQIQQLKIINSIESGIELNEFIALRLTNGSVLRITGYDFPLNAEIIVSGIGSETTQVRVDVPVDQLSSTDSYLRLFNVSAFSPDVTLVDTAELLIHQKPSCVITQMSTGFNSSLDCVVIIPTGSYGLYSLLIRPKDNPVGVPSSSDVVERKLLDSNKIFIGIVRPIIRVATWELDSCSRGWVDTLFGCGDGMLKIVLAFDQITENRLPYSQVVLRTWILPDNPSDMIPRWMSELTQTEAIHIPWTETRKPIPPQQQLSEPAVCVGGISYLGVTTFRCELVFDPTKLSITPKWMAMQLYINDTEITTIPAALLPLPRFLSIQGCPDVVGCRDGDQIGISIPLSPRGTLGDRPLPMIILRRFVDSNRNSIDTQQSQSQPECINSWWVSNTQLSCTLKTNDIVGSYQVLASVVGPGSTIMTSRSGPVILVVGNKPLIMSAVMDTCLEATNLLHCTNGVLDVMFSNKISSGSYEIVFDTSTGEVPTCTQTNLIHIDATSARILCNVAFPEFMQDVGSYSFTVRHDSGVTSDPFPRLLTGSSVGSSPLGIGAPIFMDFSISFSALDVPVQNNVFQTSINVVVNHEPSTLPDGHSIRIITGVFLPTDSRSTRILNTSHSFDFDSYNRTFVAADEITLIHIEGFRFSNAVIRAQVFYSRIAVSEAQVANWTLFEELQAPVQQAPIESPGDQNNFFIPDRCEVSEWSEYSVCSKPCGTGVIFRNRTISNGLLPPSVAPETIGCPALSQVQDCNIHACFCTPGTTLSNECNGAGSCSELGICLCRDGLKGVRCTILENVWRADLLGVLVILAVVLSFIHSWLSAHPIALLCVILEVQVLVAFMKSQCSTTDIRAAAKEMEWILDFPSPSLFTEDEVGSVLLWHIILISTIIGIYVTVVLLVFRYNNKEEDSDSRVVRKSTFASMMFPSAAVFVVLIFCGPIVFLSLWCLTSSPLPGYLSLGVFTAITFGILPLAAILYFFRNYFSGENIPKLSRFTLPALVDGRDPETEARDEQGNKLTKLRHDINKLQQESEPDEKKLTELNNRAEVLENKLTSATISNVRYTSTVDYIDGLHSEIVYAGSFKVVKKKEYGKRILISFPRFYWSSKGTADSSFKDRWGVLFTGFTALCPNFMFFLVARIISVNAILGIEPNQNSNPDGQCAVTNFITTIVHILLLIIMIRKAPWNSVVMSRMMHPVVVLDCFLGIIIASAHLVSDLNTKAAFAEATQYFVICCLSWIILTQAWGVAIWLLARLYHAKSKKEVGPFKEYLNLKRKEKEEAEKKKAAQEEEQVKKEQRVEQAAKAQQLINPLYEFELQVSKGKKVNNQLLIHHTIDNIRIESTLVPGTTITGLEKKERDEINNDTRELRQFDDTNIIEVGGLHDYPDLPPVGSLVEILPSVGSKAAKFHHSRGTVLDYNDTTLSTRVLVDIILPPDEKLFNPEHLKIIKLPREMQIPSSSSGGTNNSENPLMG